MSKASDFSGAYREISVQLHRVEPPEGWKPGAAVKLAWVDASGGLRLLWNGQPAQYFDPVSAISLARWILETFGDGDAGGP